jgi:hypothetical protein
VGQATLDGLLRAHARERPDALALADDLSGAPTRRLSFRALDRAASRLAGRLRDLGVPPGAVVAVQAANCIETVVAVLGIMRGGFTAAPIPLLWGSKETALALSGVDARALLIAPGSIGRQYIAAALRAAAETFCVRCVLSFGSQAADGVVPLGELWAEEGDSPPPGEPGRARLLTFETGVEGHTAHLRDDAALLAGGAATLRAIEMPARAAILSTMLPSSFAVVATTVASWLLSGGALTLCPLLDAEKIATLGSKADADMIVVPGPVAVPLAEAGFFTGPTRPAVVGLWRAPEQYSAAPPWPLPNRIVDVLVFGEAGFVPLPRAAGGARATIRAGMLTAEDDEDGSPVPVATLTRTPNGTLAFGGPLLPRRKGGAADAIDTGFRCAQAPDGSLSITAPPAGLVSVGGYRFALDGLGDILRRAAPDSVLAALPDLLTGQKLAGSGTDLAAIRRALSEAGANPLLAAAFRDRPAA